MLQKQGSREKLPLMPHWPAIDPVQSPPSLPKMSLQVSSISFHVSIASLPWLKTMIVFSMVAGGLQTPRKESALPAVPVFPTIVHWTSARSPGQVQIAPPGPPTLLAKVHWVNVTLEHRSMKTAPPFPEA